ncbi:DUF4097 and DUF4098 domain-containing protein YvlB [Anaerobacterium chartisolvens]|uniref:DUF4097 and DUF4098 domain-containing protein YvlB n=1 Tax=Anaerobacterium chartisolvens TaxID=1297424 RepID=A0A369BAC2_9FIRM|nr:DUF4097 family beta strand repeat-containing protein [Anaerobacterium chartisolvens]RCX18265.1 DUF4097 and DUF4098 domain-containing protein YvlB [Anaerobacterium chartisolvens]
MSLSEEKLLILKMLEEGKITSEEAAKLISALEGGGRQTAGESSFKQQQKQPSFHEEAAKLRDKIHDWKKDFKNNYSQKDFDNMVDEFSTKAEKLGKNLASTTFGFVDKMVDFVGSFVDTNLFNFFGSFPTVEKDFEVVAAEGMELNIEGINGYITVKKHTDSKIVIKSKIKSPVNSTDDILDFKDSGGSISLRPSRSGNISISHEIFLPALKFDKIRLETSNGRIYAEDSLSRVFESVTKNSHIELMGVNSDRISASTKNAKVQVNYIIGRDISINTNNAVIDIKHIKGQDVKAVTTNGKISVENVQNHESCPELAMSLKTTNAGIKVNMNDMDSRGYKIKAQTTNGGINLLIPEMTYHNINKQGVGGSFVEAESSGYGSYAEKIFINAETSNGYIEVVK